MDLLGLGGTELVDKNGRKVLARDVLKVRYFFLLFSFFFFLFSHASFFISIIFLNPFFRFKIIPSPEIVNSYTYYFQNKAEVGFHFYPSPEIMKLYNSFYFLHTTTLSVPTQPSVYMSTYFNILL